MMSILSQPKERYLTHKYMEYIVARLICILNPEKWFEGYPVKSTQIFLGCTLIFIGCRHALIFLG